MSSRLGLVIPLFLCLAACGSEPGAAGAASAPPGAGPVTLEEDAAADLAQAEPALGSLGEFSIAAVLLGNSLDEDRVVRSDGNTFSRRDTLHASVLSTGAHQGLRVSAKWTGPDGGLIAETEQAIVPTAPTATTFSVSRPEGWAPGAYQLQIAINGTPLRTRDFKVR